MTSTYLSLRKWVPRGHRAAFAAMAAALAIGVALSTVAASSAASPKVVGQVVAVGGTKRLLVRETPGGPLRQLEASDRLRLGEQVVMGRGVTATLRVSRPAGVSADLDLIELSPVVGTPHRILVSRQGANTVIRIIPG
ncbi:MAG: hypothetical protein LH654_09745 [Thermoleophilia bacterium]|nr:hypothetical protein [Thermoleophilia bacterium]